MAQATQDPGGACGSGADQGLATAHFGASAPDNNKRRAWPRPMARRGAWRGLRQWRQKLGTGSSFQRRWNFTPRIATSEPDVGTPCLELGVPGNYTWGRQPLQGLDRCIWGCEDDLTHFGPLIAKAVRVPSILYLYSLPSSYWPALL